MLDACFSHRRNGKFFWTAGQRVDPSTESEFVWRVSSSAPVSSMTYTNWNAGEPNYYNQEESCMHMCGSPVQYKWNDESCDWAFCSVCELDIA